MALLKELLRRRIPQVLALYLGACWGILEFVDFITQRFALSPHLVDLALVAPLLLLPSVFLVTYFHGAAGADEWRTVEKVGVPANLLVAVLFLVFFFHGKDLGATTTTVVVTDEEGVEMERVVPKASFRKRLTLFFFDAEPSDTAASWVQYGLPMAVLSDLVQDQFLDLRVPILFPDRLRQAGFDELVDVPLSLAREIAEEQHREYFVMGTVASGSRGFETTVSLYDAKRGSLVEEHAFAGTDLMEMADRISLQLRTDLEIPELGEGDTQDLPVAEILTDSPTAYRLSVESMVATQVDRDFGRGTELMEEAVGEDPTFADAQTSLANLYMFTNRSAEIARPLQAAMDHLYRMPERSRFIVKSNYYLLVRQDMDKAMAVLDMWADLFPDDVQAHQNRYQVQILKDDKLGALATLETLLELEPEQRDVLLQMGNLQVARGDLAAAQEVFQEYAEEFPDNHQVLDRLGSLARRMGDLDQARSYYERALLLVPEDVEAMVGLGGLERAVGASQAALDRYGDAMTAAGTPEERAQVFSALESFYLDRGQVEKSIETLEQRLAEAATYLPGFLVVQQRLLEAGTYAEAGRLEEAWALVEEARTQLPPPFDALAPLGEMDIYLALEDAEGIERTVPAVEAFITGLQYEVARPALVLAQGKLHELRGEYREAIERYEEGLRLSPTSNSVMVELGRCYRELGEYDQALTRLQQALKPAPFAPRANYEMALAYEAMDRTDEARTHLQRALEVWADADPTYRWAVRAREAMEQIGEGLGQG